MNPEFDRCSFFFPVRAKDLSAPSRTMQCKLCLIYGSPYDWQCLYKSSIIKPARCTSVSNLFYFGMTLYMFRTVFPAIHQEFKTVHTATGSCQTDTAVYLTYTCCCMYSLELLMNGRKDRPKHVECHSKIKEIWYAAASSWVYYRNNITMHGLMDVRFI